MRLSLRPTSLALCGFAAVTGTWLVSQNAATAQPAENVVTATATEQAGVDLPASVRNSATYQPQVAQAALSSAKTKLKAELATLKKRLGNAPSAKAWKAFLQLAALDQQLASATPDAEKVAAIAAMWTGGTNGLEWSALQAGRAALTRYSNLLSTVGAADAATQFATRMTELADALTKYQAEPSPANFTALQTTLTWIEQSEQVPAVVSAIRQQFNQPNFFVEIGAAVLTPGLTRPVNETAPVTDNILGTRIQGTGTTTGSTGLSFLPSGDSLRAIMSLSGTNQSRTVGFNGPAQIHSRGTTTFNSKAMVVFTPGGLAVGPALTNARTNTTTTGVCLDVPKIVQKVATKVAYKKIAEKRPQSERIAAQHAEVRIGNQFEDQLSEKLTNANEKYFRYYRHPLLRRGAFPTDFGLQTASDRWWISVVQASGKQLAAPTAAPVLPTKYDLSLRLHESSINNLGSHIAGQTVLNDTFKNEYVRLFDKLPDNWNEEEQELGSVTFADEDPVSIIFADGGFKLTLRAKQFTSGEEVYEPMNITAVYKIEKTDLGLKFVRQGKLQVLPPDFVEGEDRLPLSKTVVVNLIRKAFGKVFPEQKESAGIDLQEFWQKPGKLVVQHQTSDQGWLTIGWGLQ